MRLESLFLPPRLKPQQPHLQGLDTRQNRYRQSCNGSHSNLRSNAKPLLQLNLSMRPEIIECTASTYSFTSAGTSVFPIRGEREREEPMDRMNYCLTLRPARGKAATERLKKVCSRSTKKHDQTHKQPKRGGKEEVNRKTKSKRSSHAQSLADL